MRMLKISALTVICLFATNAAHSAVVSPIKADYGNVFPTLTEQDITVDVGGTGSSLAPWYISFNLLDDANVNLGVLPASSYFNVTSIRLVTIEGDNVKFGTDTFSVNPFLNPIEHLVSVSNLAIGKYALEVSGIGLNSFTPEFTARLQVLPATVVPVPPAIWLFGSALFGLMSFGKRKSTLA